MGIISNNNFALQQSHSKERIRINSLSPKKDGFREQTNKNQGPVAKVLTKDAEDQMREYLMQNDPTKSKFKLNFRGCYTSFNYRR